MNVKYFFIPKLSKYESIESKRSYYNQPHYKVIFTLFIFLEHYLDQDLAIYKAMNFKR